MSSDFFRFSADATVLGGGKHDEFNNDLIEALEDDGIDDLNEETFGNEEFDSNWDDLHEQTHGEFRSVWDSEGIVDGHENQPMGELYHEDFLEEKEEDLENSLSRLVVDDEDDLADDPAVMNASKTQPIPHPRRNVNLNDLFGPASPPGFLNTEDLMSPQQNIWQQPRQQMVISTPQRNEPEHDIGASQGHIYSYLPQMTQSKDKTIWGSPAQDEVNSAGQKAEQGIKSLLGLVGGGPNQPEMKIVQQHPPGAPHGPTPGPALLSGGAITLEELEKQICGEDQSQADPTSTLVKQLASDGKFMHDPNDQPSSSYHQLSSMAAPGLQDVFGGPNMLSNGSQQRDLVSGCPGGPRHSAPGMEKNTPHYFIGNQRLPFPRGSGEPHHRGPRGPHMNHAPIEHYGSPRGPQPPYGPGDHHHHPRGPPPPHGHHEFRPPGPPRGPPMPGYPHPYPPGPGQRGLKHGQYRNKEMGPGQYMLQQQQFYNHRGGHSFDSHRGRYHDYFPPHRGAIRGGPGWQQPHNFNQHRHHRGSFDDNIEQENRDPYAGLMTKREKDWVIKIQLLQLHTDNPYVDDYYFTTWHMMEVAKKREKALKEGNRDQKEKEPQVLIPQLARLETKNYKPVQFEGSLGKLTASSVHNPRQILDLHKANSIEGDEPKIKQGRRLKQLLLQIEKSYDLLLDIDDVEKKALALPEDQRPGKMQERQAMIAALLERIHHDSTNQEKFIQIASIKKGIHLIARIIPLLNKEQVSVLIGACFRQIQHFSRNELLHETCGILLFYISNAILACNFPTLVNLSEQLTVAANSAGNSLIAILENKFGSSIMWLLLTRGEVIFATLSPVDIDIKHREIWQDFVERVGMAFSQVQPHCLFVPPEGTSRVKKHWQRLLDPQVFGSIEDKMNQLWET